MTGRTLDDIRSDIDRLDRDGIMPLLVRRLELARQAAACKNSSGAPIIDSKREHHISDSFARYMSHNGMPSECGAVVARALIDAAVIIECDSTAAAAERDADN